MSKPSTYWVASPALATAGSGRPASALHAPPSPFTVLEPLARLVLLCLALLGSAFFTSAAQAARLKELANVQGVRGNPLVGYGLVVGLDGTGDQTTSAPFTAQSLNSMLQQMGVTVPPGTIMQIKNVAAVMVTAQLPAFAQPGQSIDVVVSSLGNAKSLRGGTLVVTPLKGVDGQIYAIAQGNLIVGGAGASAGKSSVQIGHLSVGRIPDGASVERAVPTPLNLGDYLQLDLNSSDYSTARQVARAINRRMGEGLAQAMDGRTVRVRMPAPGDARVSFLADIENLEVEQATPSAKVVVNARTGSVIMNQAVSISACAVAHGSLSVTINSTPSVSQPNALSQGQTVVTQKSDISIRQEPGNVIELPGTAKLSEVVRALNALGATPQDLLAILQGMKSAGALNAEIEVI
jgi:flagellar P-ring protein precursor FlgI